MRDPAEDREIGEALVEAGRLDEETVRAALGRLAVRRQAGQTIGLADLLAEEGRLGPDDLRLLMARLASHPTVASGSEEETPIDPSSARTGLEIDPHPDGTPIGRYLDAREVARGGMGVILRAIDPELGRPVAVKVLGATESSGEDRSRFLREARITGQLEHPGIPPIHELGRTPDGRPFFSMKLVVGSSLGEVLERLRQDPARARRPALRRRLLTDFLKVCDAVAYAHSRGVVHRDLKPSNVMIGEFGEVLVMDWGIAKVVGQEIDDPPPDDQPPSSDAPLVTARGTVLGTPAYMAPEQAAAETERIDRRTDVYALGAVLYELLTLSPPFLGNSTARILDAITAGRVTPPSERLPEGDLPRQLEAIVLKAMSRARGRRYQRVADLQADVVAFLDGDLPSASRSTSLEKAAHGLRRRGLRTAAVALGLGLVAVLSAVAWRGDAERRAALAARDEARLDAERAAGDHRAAAALGERADRWLGDALEDLGRRALADGRHQSAAVLLAASLVREDRPERRGLVLLALDRSWRADAGGDGQPTEILAWSPDGSRLAVAADDAVRLLDAEGRTIETRPGPGGRLRAIAWSADGTRLAAVDDAGRTRTWSPEANDDGDLSTGPVLDVRLAFADGALAAVATGDGRSLVLAGTAGEPFALDGPEAALAAVAVTAGGRVASAWFDRTVRIHDATGNLRRLLELPAAPRALAWATSAGRLAIGLADGTVLLWDTAATGPPRTIGTDDGPVRALAFSPDDRTLASADDEGGLHVRALTGPAPATSLEGAGHPATALAWSPDGRLLVAATSAGARLWRRPAAGPISWSLGRPAIGVEWSPDGSRLALLGPRGEVARVDVADPATAVGLDGRSTAIAWSPAGDRIAIGGADGSIVVRTTEGEEVARLAAGQRPAVGAVDWSPDGRRLAAAADDGAVLVWDPSTGDEPRTMIAPDGSTAAAAVAWSTDGVRLAVGRAGGPIELLDGASGEVRRTLTGHEATVRALAWAPDGRRLASASADGTVRLWDPSQATTLETLGDHGGGATGVAWSPDGRLLASAGGDGLLRLWDGSRIECLVALPLGRPVTAIAWSPDWTHLAVAGPDDLRAWRIERALSPPDRLRREVGERTGLDLVGTSVVARQDPSGKARK